MFGCGLLVRTALAFECLGVGALGGGGDASWLLFGCVDLCSCADMFFFMFGVCQCAKSRVEMHDVYVACLCD